MQVHASLAPAARQDTRPTRVKVWIATDPVNLPIKRASGDGARSRRQGHPRLPSGLNSCLLVESEPDKTHTTRLVLQRNKMRTGVARRHCAVRLHSLLGQVICSVHAAECWQDVANPRQRAGLELSAHVQRLTALTQRELMPISPQEVRPPSFSITVDATCAESLATHPHLSPPARAHRLVLSFRARKNRTVPAAKSKIYPVEPKAEPVLLLRA